MNHFFGWPKRVPWNLPYAVMYVVIKLKFTSKIFYGFKYFYSVPFDTKNFLGFYCELTVQMCTCYGYLVIYSNVNCLYHGFYLYIHGMADDFVASVERIQQILEDCKQKGNINRTIRLKTGEIRKTLKEIVEVHIETTK